MVVGAVAAPSFERLLEEEECNDWDAVVVERGTKVDKALVVLSRAMDASDIRLVGRSVVLLGMVIGSGSREVDGSDN